MPENPAQKYLVRDSQGNVYGPADTEMLRDWVRQGRIVRGMSIAPKETREWSDAAEHPALADLLGGGALGERGPSELGAREPAAAEGPVVDEPAPWAPAEPAAAEPWRTPMPMEAQSATPASIPAYSADVRRVVPDGPMEYASPLMGGRQNVPGLIGMITGVAGVMLSLPSCLCGCLSPVSGLLGVTAVVLSSIGLWKYRTSPEQYAGQGMPLAGLILGIIAVVMSLISVAIIVVSMARHP